MLINSYSKVDSGLPLIWRGQFDLHKFGDIQSGCLPERVLGR